LRPSSLGYASTLCAARVPDDQLEAFVAEVNQYPGVTHNYRRDHDLNVWFTFIAPSMEDIEKSLQAISEATGVKEIHNLPAERTFKIKVDFKFDE
jgi:DNA-binding Lrp family transcriptional regulator